MKKSALAAIITALALSQTALAEIGNTGPVTIEYIGAIGIGWGGHASGNIEIKIQGGFQLPPGVYCDTNYITTKSADDPDRAMLALLRDAKSAGRQVHLWINDDPEHTAFGGRCSINAVTIL